MSKSPQHDRKRRAARELGRERLNGVSLDDVRAMRRAEHEGRKLQARIEELRRELAYWQRHGSGQSEQAQAIQAQIVALGG